MDADKSIRRKSLGHEPPPWAGVDESDYFITTCCQNRGTNQLCLPLVGPAPIDAARFYHAQRKWFVIQCLLMPDHIHMIVNFGHRDGVAKIVGGWKRFTSIRYGVIWQKDFFDHRMRGNENWDEKADYILDNPVRAGLIADAAARPYVFLADEYSGEERRS